VLAIVTQYIAQLKICNAKILSYYQLHDTQLKKNSPRDV
jgi:hypothetical protein